MTTAQVLSEINAFTWPLSSLKFNYTGSGPGATIKAGDTWCEPFTLPASTDDTVPCLVVVSVIKRATGVTSSLSVAAGDLEGAIGYAHQRGTYKGTLFAGFNWDLFPGRIEMKWTPRYINTNCGAWDGVALTYRLVS